MNFEPLIAGTPRSHENPLRVGVLVSGSGSNLQALIDHAGKEPSSCFQIVSVVSNRKSAFALERAKTASIAANWVEHQNFASRSAFEQALIEALGAYVELVVLAGFMRILSATFLSHYANRVVNIHPALCPAFPGTHAARDALSYGARITGCTVHLVDEGVDTGPIVAQSAVPIFDEDDEHTLQARIQSHEHRLLPQTIEGIAKGLVLFDGGRIRYRGFGR